MLQIYYPTHTHTHHTTPIPHIPHPPHFLIQSLPKSVTKSVTPSLSLPSSISHLFSQSLVPSHSNSLQQSIIPSASPSISHSCSPSVTPCFSQSPFSHAIHYSFSSSHSHCLPPFSVTPSISHPQPLPPSLTHQSFHHSNYSSIHHSLPTHSVSQSLSSSVTRSFGHFLHQSPQHKDWLIIMLRGREVTPLMSFSNFSDKLWLALDLSIKLPIIFFILPGVMHWN